MLDKFFLKYPQQKLPSKSPALLGLRLLDTLANFPLTTRVTKREVINMVYTSCITSCQTT